MEIQRYNRALRSMFPKSVLVNAVNFHDMHAPVFPEEEYCIQNACPQRQKEFRAGRTCARQLLGNLGQANTPVVMSSDHSPVWPVGIVGSISHVDTLCSVAVAHRANIRSLGIDMAKRGSLDDTLYGVVLTHKEVAWLTSLPSKKQNETATLMFSSLKFIKHRTGLSKFV